MRKWTKSLTTFFLVLGNFHVAHYPRLRCSSSPHVLPSAAPLCHWLRAGIAGHLASSKQWMLECSQLPLTPYVAVFEITAGKISGTYVKKACNLILLAYGATVVYICLTCEFVCLIQILLETCSSGGRHQFPIVE